MKTFVIFTILIISDVLGKSVLKNNYRTQIIGRQKQEINTFLKDGIYTLI